MSTQQSLTQRSIVSVKWNAIANVLTFVLSFFGAIVLARKLPVATFGIYAAATAVVQLASIVSDFGFGSAFLHRSPETLDLEQAAPSHFTINSLFTLGWLILMFAGVSIFLDATQAELRLALSVLIIGEVVEELTQTNRMILVRQVQHRRLAFMQMVDSILSVLASIGLALAGFGIWALLINDILDAVTKVFFFWLWRPSWRPSLRWDRAAIRYFLRFGSQTFVGRFILEGLDRFDDIWTAIYLGNTQLGYYSRAFRFATYPRSFIAYPIYQVASGVYSELKGDRKRLSTAFMQINSFMVRSGFLLAGLIALVAPEFIRIALGDKWLPMLTAFQLMLVFTLFDPVKQTMANLFLALGLPGEVIWFRFIQLLVMIAGLFLLGFRFGIEGVALAVDIMLVVGMVLMLWRSKTYVDYSLRRLLVVPTVALFAGLAAGLGAVHWPNLIWSDWLSGIVKSILFVVIYSVILILWDRQQVKETWLLVRQNLMKG